MIYELVASMLTRTYKEHNSEKKTASKLKEDDKIEALLTNTETTK